MSRARSAKNRFRSHIIGRLQPPASGQVIIAPLLLVALLAFEIFNFDTTRYALTNLLGEVSFVRLRWATILAIAFCSIDLAGLLRFFMPEPQNGRGTPKEVWYLMGAWMLGATMNAIMTWWAVSLTLLQHDLGNEILSRQQLLAAVPVFVAALVWLTRILFIGSLTVAGGYVFVGQKRPSQATIRTQQRTYAAVSNDHAPPAPRPAFAHGTGAGPTNEVTIHNDFEVGDERGSDEIPVFLRKRPSRPDNRPEPSRHSQKKRAPGQRSAQDPERVLKRPSTPSRREPVSAEARGRDAR